METIFNDMKKIFSWYKGKGMFWFRLFGYGLSISNRFTFSQRQGYVKYIYLYGYIITFLKPNKI
jgi:hypothetical protein